MGETLGGNGRIRGNEVAQAKKAERRVSGGLTSADVRPYPGYDAQNRWTLRLITGIGIIGSAALVIAGIYRDPIGKSIQETANDLSAWRTQTIGIPDNAGQPNFVDNLLVQVEQLPFAKTFRSSYGDISDQ